MATKRLYVGGLHPDIKEEELVSRFSRFGSIKTVELKVRKDEAGVPTKTFAYMNIESTDADLQKCYSTYNRSKWKGSELIIQVAKENFLERLEKERKMSLEEKEATPKAPEPVAPLKKPGEDAGVENFQLKAPPGTVIPGEKDWVVGKYGRVLPVVHIRKKGSRKTMSVDPSKFTHNVKTFKEEAEIDGKSVQTLTWELNEKDDELTRKRKGDFPKWKSSKKNRKGQKDVISFLNEKEKERKIEEEVEVVPVSEDAFTLVSEPQSQAGHKSSIGQMDLSKFDSDSDSDEDSVENQAVNIIKDKSLLKRQSNSIPDRADKKVKKDDPVVKPKRKLCEFKGTKHLSNSVENIVSENSNENVGKEKPARKLKEFKGTKMLDNTANENDEDIIYRSNFESGSNENNKKTPTKSSNTSHLKNFYNIGNLKPHVVESDSSLKVYSIDDFSSVLNCSTQNNVSTDEDDESDFETLVKREEAKLKAGRNGVKNLDNTMPVVRNESFTKKVYHSSDSENESLVKRVDEIEGLKKTDKNTASKTKLTESYTQISSGFRKNTAEIKGSTIDSEDSVSDNYEEMETISREYDGSSSSSEDDSSRDESSEESVESSDESDSSDEVNTDLKVIDKNVKSNSTGKLEKGGDVQKGTDESDDKSDSEMSDGSNEDQESNVKENEGSSDEDEIESLNDSESESDDSDFEKLVAKEVNKVDSSTIQNEKAAKKVTMKSDEKCKQKDARKSKETENQKESIENQNILAKKTDMAINERLTKVAMNVKMTAVKANNVVRPDKEITKDDDQKRREAVKQRQKENLAQKSAIQTALANMDAGVTSNKKIVFDSDSDEDVPGPVTAPPTLPEASDETSSSDSEASEASEHETEKQSVGKGRNLFDSSDDDDSDEVEDGDRFDLRPQFEGAAGEKLMKLQSRYGNDERFKLDKRFEEPGSDNEAVDEEEDNEMGSEDEKVRAFKILQSVVGTPVSATTAREKEKKKFKDMSSLKYDPSKEDHSQFEIKSAPKTDEDKNRKKKKKELEEEPKVEMPEVSKEKFYEMSDNLREQFIARATTEQPSGQGFSLLAAFGRQHSDDEEIMQEEEAIPIQSSLTTDHLSLDNRFKVTDDQSDSDQESVELTDDESTSQIDEKTAQPAGDDKPKQPSTNSFFFTEDDERLKEGEKFYRTDDVDTVREAWNKTRRDYIESYRFKQKRVKRQAKATPVAKRGRRK